MYFEDIFEPIIKLWKSEFYLEYGNKKKSYIKSIGDDYDEIEYIVEQENLNNQYNGWHFMMVFTNYSTITDYGLDKLSKGIKTLKISDIPIELFERDYLNNLKEQGNEKSLREYRGFKPDVLDMQ